MGVACASNILGRGAVFVSKDTLCNHFTGVCAHDVDAKHSVCLSTGQNLNQTLRVLNGSCARVGAEWEHALSIWGASLLQLFFSLSYVSDFRVSVDDTWDGIVVDVTAFSKNVLNSSDALLFGLVSQHLSLSSITDSVNGGDLGLPVVVGKYLTTLVHLNTSVLEAETISKSMSADRDEAHIDVELGLLVCLGVQKVDRYTISLVVHTIVDASVHQEFHTLLLQ